MHNNINKIIMGIDPGYDRVGIGIINRENNKDFYIYSTCIQSNKKDDYVSRVLYINNELEKIIIKYKPNLIVIESLFFAKNAKTAIDVAQARGSILLTICKYFYKYISEKRDNLLENNNENLIGHILELTPMQIKSSLTGDGHADKDKVSYMVYQILF